MVGWGIPLDHGSQLGGDLSIETVLETALPAADSPESPPKPAPKRDKQKPKSTPPVLSDPIPFKAPTKPAPPPGTDPITPFDPLPPPKAARAPATGGVSGPPKPLPAPPVFDFSDDIGGFFKYWASLSPEELNRSLVYVYRNWPVWDPALLLTEEEKEQVRRKELRLITNIGKLSQPFKPKDWEREIYHRWGTGDYHLKLNDTHKAFAKTICMVTIKGLRDFENYPPVLDSRAVVMSDPANASYIEKMRLKGKLFPGDPGLLESEMGAEAVKEMTSIIDKLTGRILEKPAVSTTPDPRAHAELKAVESVAEGAKQGMQIMGDAMKQAQAAQTKAQDPKEYLRDLLTVAEAIRPPAPPADTTTSQIVAMMQSMMQMQQQHAQLMMEELRGRLQFTERTLQSVMEKAAQPPTPPANVAPTVNQGPRSFVDELERFMTMKDRLDGIFGGGGSDGGAPTWAPIALKGLGVVAAAAANITHNLAIAKTGAGSAIAPPQFDTELPSAENESQPNPPNQEANVNIIAFAQRLHAPLVNALTQGIPGQQFAAQMILHEGAMSYNYLAGQGKEGILSLLQMYPPIWSDVIKVPQQFDVFLDGFILTEEAHALAEEMRASAQDMAPQPPQHPHPGQPAQSPTQAPPQAPRPSAQAPTPQPQSQTQSQPMAPQPGEARRKVVGPNGQHVEVIAPRTTQTHRPPTVSKSTPNPEDQTQ